MSESPEKKEKREGIEQGIYTTWIKSELTDEAACLELPFTIVLLISFSLAAVLHLQSHKVFVIEEAIENDIVENANFAWAYAFGHKGLFDVNAICDFWSWVRLGFLPLIIQPSWAYSEDLGKMEIGNYSADNLPTVLELPGYTRPAPVRNDYLRYQRMIGAIRFRQEIVEPTKESCVVPKSIDRGIFDAWFQKPCQPSSAGELPPELFMAESFGVPERVEWMLLDVEELDEMLMRLADMEDGCSTAKAENRTCLCVYCAEKDLPWLDEATTRIEIAFVVFNPSYGLYSAVGVNLWFNRGGRIHKIVSTRSAWASLFTAPLSELIPLIFADTIWVLSVLYVFVNEGKEIWTVIQSSQEAWHAAVMNEYMEAWNMVDWISIAVAFAVIIMQIQLVFVTDEVNVALAGFANRHSSASSNVDKKRIMEEMDSFFVVVEAMFEQENNFRLALACYPMIVMMRLFKSFAAQPRLAVVTATLGTAAQDMFHFGIVFFSVYFCMTINGLLFFGQDVADFSTLDRVMHTTFRFMFGDWDWDEIKQVGRYKAAFWFWSFLLVVVTILLNMLLAIIMDAYGEVKSGTAGAVTLEKQTKEIIRRWRQFKRGERVRLNDIFDALLKEEKMDEQKMLESKKFLTPDMLLQIVPNLKPNQAKRTMNNSRIDYEKRNQEPFGIEEVGPVIERLDERLNTIHQLSHWLGAKFIRYRSFDQGGGGEMSAASRSIAAQDAQAAVDELTEGMASALAEEIRGLEMRQKRQQDMQEKMEGELSTMRTLVTQLNQTMSEISQLTHGESTKRSRHS